MEPLPEATSVSDEAVAVMTVEGIAPPVPPPTTTVKSTIDEAKIRQFLKTHRWPKGLQDVFIQQVELCPLRFFIVDDSGSMSANDGNKLSKTADGHCMTHCTRWAEVTDTIKFHIALSRQCDIPAEFRMLNSIQPIRIGLKDKSEAARYGTLMRALNESPQGSTPICRHIKDIIKEVQKMEKDLRAKRQKICVVILTDGESSDGDLAHCMKPLSSLPVWVVVRLCTDEEKVVNYWNDIDKELELDIEVLDDFYGEAEEIYAINPWFSYGEPMQRLREFGVCLKEIDLLDEVKLDLGQVRLFCSIIFGGSPERFPDPDTDWEDFLNVVKEENLKLEKTWSPIDRLEMDWISTERLQTTYKSSCVIS